MEGGKGVHVCLKKAKTIESMKGRGQGHTRVPFEGGLDEPRPSPLVEGLAVVPVWRSEEVRVGNGVGRHQSEVVLHLASNRWAESGTSWTRHSDRLVGAGLAQVELEASRRPLERLSEP